MKKAYLLMTSALVTSLAAYESNPGWKKDDAGNLVLKDGNPVYVTTSGQEQVVGGNTIAERNVEAKTQRERAEAAEALLKKFDGLDAEIARKAVETVGKLDAKQLIDAGKVDEVKKQITDQFTTQITEKEKAVGELQSRINDMMVSDVFKSSEFLRDGIAMPRDFIEAAFKSQFKIEDGKVAAYDKAGNRIMSKEKMGEFASGDEALRLLVEAHPNKEQILKADVGNGSGNGGGGGARGAGRVMKRADFDQMSPVLKKDAALKMGAGELTIVD